MEDSIKNPGEKIGTTPFQPLMKLQQRLLGAQPGRAQAAGSARARGVGMVLTGLVLVLATGIIHWKRIASQPADLALTATQTVRAERETVTRDVLAKTVGEAAWLDQFPTEIEIPGIPGKSVIQYSFDPRLQQDMQKLMRSYRPDYGAFVAMDAETGQILAIVSYTGDPAMRDNLALRATFPSASVFKVVTAAAAIENDKLSGDSIINFNGANHTLYRGNILQNAHNRWTRHVSLKEAFAKSINTVFGRIGAYDVGPEKLSEYAGRFGFNHSIPADLPVQPGRAPIPSDPWGLAETASGFTRDNTMSPIQGALIAASVVNEGRMMEPFLVQSVYSQNGTELYKAQPTLVATTVDPATAAEIRRLMHETVAHGTSHKSFRGFSRGKFRDLEVGGKTGSLTGMDPPGKYDWFVGFAEGRARRIAFAALTIHQRLWRVKSSYLVRRGIESFFGRQSQIEARNDR